MHLEIDAVPACLERVHALLDAVWRDARPPVPAPLQARFSTAVAELAANVVEHGARPTGGPPRMVLDVWVTPRAVLGTLEDDGRAAPDPGPCGGAPALDVDPLAESGRGLELARATLDALALERDGGRNRWSLRVDRP
ncbi:ATP-binding protein [Patulibacter sp. SYSU D01012]|uniref:ATP-binding protein n=1 Tax=Patulibacter sp. SYSU D01012 TaxID=2817381 RepID=UPI001B3013C5|nr:ATP-binding protein [Patulibacter sp. SYSU D01012]